MNKKLYKATFNYAGINYLLFTTSTSNEKAFLNCINQLSKCLMVGKRTLMFAFNGSKDNYRIEFVKEVKK